MPKKSFTKENPALQFINVSPPQPQQDSAEAAVQIKRRPESRSRRVQLLMKPSIHAQLMERAQDCGTSLNDLINTVLEAYINSAE